MLKKQVRRETMANQYDVIIIGAGPGGIFSAYELSRLMPELKIAILEAGGPLEKSRTASTASTVPS